MKCKSMNEQNDVDSRKRRNKMKEATTKYLREFSDVTTLHGIRYVTEEKTHFVERLCWAIAILLCATYCGWEITKVWSRWQNTPVIISFAQRPTSVASIPLPSLTICPENKVRKSVIDLEQNFNQLEAYLNGSKEFESEEHKLLIESISIVCLQKTKNITYLLPYNVKPTVEHLKMIAQNVSLQSEDIFETCYFESNEFDCKQLFRPILTQYGLCYTFNTLGSKDLYTSPMGRYPLDFLPERTWVKTWDPEKGYSTFRGTDDFPLRNGVYVGPKMGLEVVLKSQEHLVQKTCSSRDEHSFRITVQSPIEFPDPYYGNYFHVSPGSDTSIALQPVTVTTAPELRSYPPNLRGCNFPEDKKLQLFSTYSHLNCIFECENSIVREKCGCLLIYMPIQKDDNASYCSYSNIAPSECGDSFQDEFMKIFYEDVEDQIGSEREAAACDCLPSCSDLQYNFHVSRDVNCNNNSSNKFASLNMYFESQSFFGKHRSELYGVTDFIASCGGLLGLFTGFSIITAFEIFYFATLRLACKLKRKRDNVILENSDEYD